MSGSWTPFFIPWNYFDSMDSHRRMLGAQKQSCSANRSKRCRFGSPIYGRRKKPDAVQSLRRAI